jgi:16S rRNA (cytosine967-C5)-methyltransferase
MIQQVLYGGRSLTDLLATPGHRSDDPRDQAFTRALSFGVLRWYSLLQALLGGYLKKPLRERERDLEILLLTGIYQLGWMQVPSHAAVSESVAVCKHLNKPWAKALVNGVLRSYQRAGTPMQDETLAPHISSAHPGWLYRRLKSAWPDQIDQITTANNLQGPMWLRVNHQRISTEDYLEQLKAAGLEAQASPWVSSALRLSTPQAVSDLPGFSDGLVSVQDAAAQLAASLLPMAAGQRVLDACAAPGGKSAHLLERQADIELTALDISAERSNRIKDNLQRLGLSAQVVVGDAGQPKGWWDKQPYDAILLDAPCSASGVIRRHPDIKWLRRSSDISALASQQQQLLEQLWPLLRRGGTLLYATCSVLPEENAEQIAAFTQRHDDARLQIPTADWGQVTTAGRQVLPGEDGMDGFFYAALQKT